MDTHTGDINIVEIWLRRDPIRWIAGALAGLFAGAMMIGLAMLAAKASGAELWYPVKIAALPFLGPSALEYGDHFNHILVGLVSLSGLCVFLGVVYAHFTGTNNLAALAGVGLVWGIFGWIFINNLFTQSINPVFWAHISRGAAFPIYLVFGLGLTSVAFFDRALRGGRT